MKMWQIVKGMSDGEFTEGQMFQNGDLGDLVIHNDELCYADILEPIAIVVGDDNDWQLITQELDWELEITQRFGN